MPKVCSKKQVILPIDALLLAGIGPGDEVEIFFERNGVLSVVKKDVDSLDSRMRRRILTNQSSLIEDNWVLWKMKLKKNLIVTSR